MAMIALVRELSTQEFENELRLGLQETFKPSMKVAVKLHMGEGKGMFSPEIAKRSVSVLKNLGCNPFLFDTPTVYNGPRHTKEGYEKLAFAHGFSEGLIGCPVIISDDYIKIKTAHMTVEVSRELAESDGLLVLTHVKGHDCSGFGGSIKNLAMGCASPASKGFQHSLGKPELVESNCIGCKICEGVCFFKAIAVEGKAIIDLPRCVGCGNCVLACPNNALHCKVMFDTLLAESAYAALKSIEGKPVFYVNDARRITKHCDCCQDPGEPVADDIGVFLGNDLVAIEMASLDMINKNAGKNIFWSLNHHDPYLSVLEAEKAGLGSRNYSMSDKPC